ncbi:hypothetical protein LG200_07940 [Methylobacillus caricis]|uniref:hypothetical protein n=1 Tax=Methylobacillus caricis TaxID=1971611 RepID=UPI001D000A35|nr:hypothetical protein [Methylobacillus caricis]MCB5187936.1 hypothetical protein [Methylobacillus caricis]
MKQITLRLAVLSALGLISAQATATGLEPIPATGFSGTAYRLCNTTGNFGSSITTAPTTLSNNDCAVFPANDSASPVTGFTLAANASRPVVMNNTYTNFTNVTVGTVTDRVWRNAAATECIFGTKFVPANIDYRPTVAGDPDTVGNQYFEVNDIARGGFSSSGTVQAGYFVSGGSSSIYRIGRTYTAVQHRALQYDTATNKAIPGTNYVALPPAPGSAAAINGEDFAITATTPATTVAANQNADVNSEWVDFTFDAVWADDDGSTNPASPMTYIQAPCSAGTIPVATNAIRLRQTAQEYARFIQVSVDGFAPTNATPSPAPVVPF